MIFVLVAFFSFLLLMLHDLGDTRDGFWRVDTGEYGELREELAAEAARSAQRSPTPSGQTRR